jgi:hypothetical protein
MKVTFTTTILKFGNKGEKTGWTYIVIPPDVANQLKRGTKKSFRVKGLLDRFAIKGVALLPMGSGEFIMPLNAAMRKGIGKKEGAMLQVTLDQDKAERKLDAELIECLEDDPQALAFFKSLPNSHQYYFSKWISDAKTIPTKTKRIAAAVNGLSQKQRFSQVLRNLRNKN